MYGLSFIFRGALDVRATTINEAMKMAAVKALADLAKESVPEQVNLVYDQTRLPLRTRIHHPKNLLIPVISTIPVAVAKAAIESGVATEPIEDWERYTEELSGRLGNSQKMVRLLHDRAKAAPKRLVFAEADQMDVLKAAQIVHEEGIAIPIF